MISGQEGEGISYVEMPKSERLSDGDVGSLLSAVGNHEGKAVTLLSMADGGIYTSNALDKKILAAQGQKVGWKMGATLPFSFCSLSLSPIGLVTRELLNPDLSTYGYQITDYGRRIGIPFCGLTLDWSLKRNIFLAKLWGSTASRFSVKDSEQSPSEEAESKKRAPITTLKILYELVTEPKLPIREADLIVRIGEYHALVRQHLQRLYDAGLIQYQSTAPNSAYSAYKLVPSFPTGDLPILRSDPSLTQAVLTVLRTHPNDYLAIEDVYNFLPEELRTKRKGLMDATAGTLSHLRKNKYLESKKFFYSTRSEINLTDEQRATLAEILEIIDRIQNLDPEVLERGAQLADRILNNPSEVSTLLGKAKEASSRTDKISVSDTQDLINYLVSANPGITNRGIRALLQKEGRNLSAGRIMELTSSMEKIGLVQVEQEGIVRKFYPVRNSNQPKE